ncbi:PREDICTED: uncharacterized protein LOC105361685 [Ceratosolen solmsi marchali]|uniref:Uncharacterized protein LOC105361685 n=1 Tax=Ceratosolen solmsi marchali TaxID=326594 RepID=A0AAJ6YFQ4_9HYME|nr:PREDICTED: uncharacterized protein LOC105361685 [Ceratosolen solmsi marchali]
MLDKPDANSTPLFDSISSSKSEIEITPIIKGLLLSVSESNKYTIKNCNDIKNLKQNNETSEFTNKYKLYTVKYELKTLKSSKYYNRNYTTKVLPLKRSSSMHLVASSSSTLPLKRSQSELNLHGKEKTVPQLIFNSTSSTATIVDNKPSMNNKFIETSIKTCTQEFLGLQVPVLKEEEKLPLPDKLTSFTSRMLNSILKNSKGIYKNENSKQSSIMDISNTNENEQNRIQADNSSNSSYNIALMLQENNTENITGLPNSSNISTALIYENIPYSSSSQVSSIETGCSNSTVPNTSSSVDEKLWGNSNSLVHDIERSVNILKSLVDANKLDKHVKKRLIHHVIKRLVNAKYTDDQIKHNLEENVPWDPAEGRNKVHQAEILQALAKNITESSEDLKPLQKRKNIKKSASTNEFSTIKDIINIPTEIESSNSDKLDRNIDRTTIDGRNASVGLQDDDCNKHSSNLLITKSESSECFLPQQRYNKNNKMKDIFITSTSLQEKNRAFLDAVINSRQNQIESSNEPDRSMNWRLPATLSERMYKFRQYSNSDSEDTKLVSYAKKEKRNQLIWINNEINHLSNLKKLLEESKIKSKKLGKFSFKTVNHQQQATDNNLLSKQWSSHNNLANSSLLINTNTIRHFKKRNSCTQTATKHSFAYSRTGSEIVSAKVESSNIKLTNAYIQTLQPLKSLTSDLSTSKLYAGCPVHQAVFLTCTCSEQVCLFCSSKYPLHHQLLTNDNPDVLSKINCKFNDVEKEIKNQINKTKVKCMCEPNDKKCNIQKVGKLRKSTDYKEIHNKRRCEGLMCLCRRYKLSEQLTEELSRKCNCEDNKFVSNFEKMNIKKFSKETKFPNASSTVYNCKCNNLKKRLENNYFSKRKIRPCCLDNSNKEINNFLDHCCMIKSEDQENIYPSINHSMQMFNDSISNEYKCCPICGMIFQNERNCGCVIKNYPKSIAYELIFFNDKKINEIVFQQKVDLETKNVEKEDLISNKLIHENNIESCMCEISQHTINLYNHNYNNEQLYKLNSEKGITLQDYLIANNPGFTENVEIRRQYVSEIQRLRQLKKKKRVQLLSMKTISTNLVMSSKQAKVTNYTQRKISDKDMKMRLRKRYSQLTENQTKRKQQKLQQETRCNKLMAKIFCKKLQQKVLRGQVDLSQSVSVLSNL